MNEALERVLLEWVRVVNDFPKPGIAFRDITTLLADHELSRRVLDELVSNVPLGTEAIAGIESRGFLFGMAMALEAGLPFIPIRKKGKLPHLTTQIRYELEYGHAEIEVHTDSISQGMKVHVHDDILATGGSAMAAAQLVRNCGGEVSGFSFLMSISALGGEQELLSESSIIAILARC